MTLGSEFGWANALPDSDAQVDLTINGTQVKFSGAGYHDKVSEHAISKSLFSHDSGHRTGALGRPTKS